MNYFSSLSLQVGKSAAAEKMSISRTNLYYKPKLPAKDLALKQQIESICLEHRAYSSNAGNISHDNFSWFYQSAIILFYDSLVLRVFSSYAKNVSQS